MDILQSFCCPGGSAAYSYLVNYSQWSHFQLGLKTARLKMRKSGGVESGQMSCCNRACALSMTFGAGLSSHWCADCWGIRALRQKLQPKKMSCKIICHWLLWRDCSDVSYKTVSWLSCCHELFRVPWTPLLSLSSTVSIVSPFPLIPSFCLSSSLSFHSMCHYPSSVTSPILPSGDTACPC